MTLRVSPALTTPESPPHSSQAEGVRNLLQYTNVTVDLQDKRGFTALHIAAKSSDKDVVSALLEAGAQPHIVTFEHRLKPAFFATREDVHQLFDSPASALLEAAKADAEALRGLLGQGLDPNVRDEGHWSPLMRAALYDHDEAVGLLLAAGADPRAVLPPAGFSAALWALWRPKGQCLRRLQAAGNAGNNADRFLSVCLSLALRRPLPLSLSL